MPAQAIPARSLIPARHATATLVLLLDRIRLPLVVMPRYGRVESRPNSRNVPALHLDNSANKQRQQVCIHFCVRQ